MRKLLVCVATLLLATARDRGADRPSPADGGKVVESDTAAAAVELVSDHASSSALLIRKQRLSQRPQRSRRRLEAPP